MRVRFIFTVQGSLALGPGMFRLLWIPLKGDVMGRQLWLGPLGLGFHVIAKDPRKDQPTAEDGPPPTGAVPAVASSPPGGPR